MDFFTNIDIAGLAALAFTVFSIYKSIRSKSKDDASQDATTAHEYEETARLADERAEKMSKRVDSLEDEVTNLKKDMESVCKERNDYLKILVEWARGFTMLQYQLKNLQVTAIYMPKQEDIDRFKEL